MKEEAAKELYEEFVQLQTQAEQIQQHFQAIQQQLQAIQQTKQTIAALQDVKEPVESWIAVAPGAYAKATIKPADTMLLNIGANTAVEKKPEDVLSTLDEHQRTLESLGDEALKEFKEIMTAIDKIKHQVGADEQSHTQQTHNHEDH